MPAMLCRTWPLSFAVLPQGCMEELAHGSIRRHSTRCKPMTHRVTLLPETFAVCRLEPGNVIQPWATTGRFFSITRTTDELSIVCDQAIVPDGVRCERDWRCFKLAGPIPFSTVGVLASLVTPLADA